MAPANIASCCLTTEQKEALIDLVRQRPVIWDCSLDAYQEVQNRRAAFAEVALLLSDEKNKYTGPEMQVEWKKLRDIFNRTLKRVVSAGGNADTEVTWRYWQKLQFIADHERTQIFKAMHKWSQKMGPPTKRRLKSSSGSQQQQASPQATASTSSVTSDPSLSMVQQLADGAQSTNDLLKQVDADDDLSLKLEAEDGANKSENGEEEENGAAEGSIGDALGQILLLSSQIGASENGVGDNNNNSVLSGGGSIASSSNHSSNGVMAEQHQQQPTENDFPIRFLNEWLMKGSTCSLEVSNGSKNNAMAPVVPPSSSNGVRRHLHNGRRSHQQQQSQMRTTAATMVKRARWETATTTATGELANGTAARQRQQQDTAGDQFDVFGMFVASQVRQLSLRSPTSALRLKRALTELCFQFEAEEHNANNSNGVKSKLYTLA